jgi:broad specificity phosphatase PhoE
MCRARERNALLPLSTPRTLLLIRHAAPERQPSLPAREWRLSPRGRASCAALAEAVAPYAPRAVIASEEPKARETAELVAHPLGLSVETEANLHEQDRRAVPYFGSTERFAAVVRAFFARPDELVFGGETAAQACERFAAAVDEVLATYPTANLAIVTHGTVISLVVGARTNTDPYTLWQRLGLPALLAIRLPEWHLETMITEIGDDAM